ncbi:hypothetical protein GCK32_006478 [Trichostrongylus colubriformis]|uniref:Uncharacterized protein n=1 Tax=Trichostrongylus colubriformis TaxID=6319 RepID=A0AAN8IR61_TRICO
MATSPLNIKNTRGVVMINAAGLRIHRGIEPLWKIDITLRLLDLRVFNFLLHPFLYCVYNYFLGLRVPSGSAAEVALRSMRTFAFGRLAPCLDVINGNNQALPIDTSLHELSLLQNPRFRLEMRLQPPT